MLSSILITWLYKVVLIDLKRRHGVAGGIKSGTNFVAGGIKRWYKVRNVHATSLDVSPSGRNFGRNFLDWMVVQSGTKKKC